VKLIAFYGPPGSGKTTACAYLARTRGAVEINFADALREELAWALVTTSGLPPARWADNHFLTVAEMKDPATKTPFIPLLQAWGAFRRGQNPHYWVIQWLQGVRAAREMGSESVVCGDLRYDNEREAIYHLLHEPVGNRENDEAGAENRENDVITALVNRVLVVLVDAPTRMLKPAHESERDWLSWTPDYIVDNRGTPTQYKVEIDRLWSSLGE
jgi:DNA polymerase III delta prime subunit